MFWGQDKGFPIALFLCRTTLVLVRHLAFLLVFLWVGLAERWARADEETLDLASVEWDGLSDFVAIAQAELPGRVVSRSHLDYGELKREDGVLLVHPDAAIDAESLARFM